MVLKINGTDILPYVDGSGIKWQRNDLDGPKAGRTLDGTMHRGRVAMKMRLDITCKPLTTSEAHRLLNLIEPEYVDVRYTDPMNGEVTKRMYSNNIPATVGKIQKNGTVLWTGITFPLIER